MERSPFSNLQTPSDRIDDALNDSRIGVRFHEYARVVYSFHIDHFPIENMTM